MVKCLAPDSELGGIGCDNMTVVIVALLNGRTLDEWSAWIKERVEKKGVWSVRCRRISADPRLQSATRPQNPSPTSLATRSPTPRCRRLPQVSGKRAWAALPTCSRSSLAAASS